MPAARDDQHRAGNRLLAALPNDDYQRLRPHLQPVKLKANEILCESGEPLSHAYFITRGVVSLLATTLEGNMVEVGMVGREGLIGLPILLRCGALPWHVMTQLPMEALRVPTSVLRHEFKHNTSINGILLRYACARMTHLTQSGVCNHFHSIEQRLCRWLLILHEHAKSDLLQVTQELLAGTLGVRRAGVSLVAGRLQEAGLIRYRRGRLRILDRAGLEATACECYGIISREYEQMFAT